MREPRYSPGLHGKPLSPREREIHADLARGMTAQASADEHRISVKTVETYRRRIYVKLGVRGFRDVMVRSQLAEAPLP